MSFTEKVILELIFSYCFQIYVLNRQHLWFCVPFWMHGHPISISFLTKMTFSFFSSNLFTYIFQLLHNFHLHLKSFHNFYKKRISTSNRRNSNSYTFGNCSRSTSGFAPNETQSAAFLSAKHTNDSSSLRRLICFCTGDKIICILNQVLWKNFKYRNIFIVIIHKYFYIFCTNYQKSQRSVKLSITIKQVLFKFFSKLPQTLLLYLIISNCQQLQSIIVLPANQTFY